MSENVGGEGSDNTIGIEIVGLKKLQIIQDGFVKRVDAIFDRHGKLMQAAGNIGGKGGTSLSNKLVIIGETQTQLQRMMVERLGQITINTASKWQKEQMLKQQTSFDKLFKSTKISLGASNDGKDKNFGDRIWDAFKNLGGMMKRVFKGLQKAWNKTAGALFKKTGGMGINKLLGLGGAAVLGALVGKMISSSPMLQAMFKIMNTSLTLILRPIGDFFGSFLRPMSIYFLKEVAIPFFRENKKLMKIGEQWGRTALGFFINPGKAIESAIVLALSSIPILDVLLTSAKGRAESKWFQQDPGSYKRWEMGMTGDREVKTPLAWNDPEGELAGQGLGGLTYDEYHAKGGGGLVDVAKKQDKFKEEQSKWFLGGLASLYDNSLLKRLIEYLQAGPFPPVWPEEDDHNDQLIKNTDILKEWGDSWDEFTASIDSGAKDWHRKIIQWADEQGTAYDNWKTQVEEDTASWLEWAGAGVEQGWEWITNFGKVNEAFAETGKDSKEAQVSLVDNFWSWVESIKVAIFGTRVATDAFAETIITAGDKITIAADIATGGIFSIKDKPGRQPSAGTGENPWNPLDAITSVLGGTPSASAVGDGGIVGTGTVGTDSQWSNKTLGQFSTGKIESSPGKFVDIYSKGGKVDPQSEEGKTIQGIYQTQYDNKLRNEKQQAIMKEAVKVTSGSADAGKAYILAGGGEVGIAAVAFAEAQGLDLSKYKDIIALSEKFGFADHPMVKTAKEGLAKKIAMAEKIMADRVAAGQTPSIQGDMLELFPNAEDSTFGWSDERLADFDAMNQARYDQMAEAVTGSSTPITQTTLDPGTGYVGGIDVAPWLSGGFTYNPTTSKPPPPGPRPGGYGGGNPGGRGPGGNTGPGGGGTGGPRGGGNPGGGGKGPGGGATGTGGRKGGGGAGPGGGGTGGGGTASGSKGTGSKGKSGQGRRQFGGIIDEPILGIGLHSGDEWRLGESQKEIVTPLGEYGSDGNFYSINIHVGNITKEADYMKLKPLIQRWILEASSRRGMV